jgi:L-aspartate oxidase
MLDLRRIDRGRFPTLMGSLIEEGYDPAETPIPVAPAAHYTVGGVVTDLDGHSELPGLYAAGETAATGVHGANRLASNSLLDGLVFGTRIVRAMTSGKDAPDETGVLRGIDAPRPVGVDPARTESAPTGPTSREELQRLMTRDAGVLRDRASLEHALAHLATMDPSDREVANLIAVSSALVGAALAREESRGTHTRIDFPDRSPEFAGRLVFAGAPEPVFVPLPEPAVTR